MGDSQIEAVESISGQPQVITITVVIFYSLSLRYHVTAFPFPLPRILTNRPIANECHLEMKNLSNRNCYVGKNSTWNLLTEITFNYLEITAEFFSASAA